MTRGLAIVRGRTLTTAEFVDDTILQDIRITVFKFEKVCDWYVIIKRNFDNSFLVEMAWKFCIVISNHIFVLFDSENKGILR